MFRDEAGYAVGIPLIYGIAEPLVIGPFCLLAWRLDWTYGSRNLPFFAWLFGNHQPQDAESKARRTQALH